MIPEVKPITSLFNKRSEVSLDKKSLKHYLENNDTPYNFINR